MDIIDGTSLNLLSVQQMISIPFRRSLNFGFGQLMAIWLPMHMHLGSGPAKQPFQLLGFLRPAHGVIPPRPDEDGQPRHHRQ
ncbi:hypothetical protein D3C73_1382010 [compost metagenome]